MKAVWMCMEMEKGSSHMWGLHLVMTPSMEEMEKENISKRIKDA